MSYSKSLATRSRTGDMRNDVVWKRVTLHLYRNTSRGTSD